MDENTGAIGCWGYLRRCIVLGTIPLRGNRINATREIETEHPLRTESRPRMVMMHEEWDNMMLWDNAHLIQFILTPLWVENRWIVAIMTKMTGSHQSITTWRPSAPERDIGEGLSYHYSQDRTQ